MPELSPPCLNNNDPHRWTWRLSLWVIFYFTRPSATSGYARITLWFSLCHNIIEGVLKWHPGKHCNNQKNVIICNHITPNCISRSFWLTNFPNKFSSQHDHYLCNVNSLNFRWCLLVVYLVDSNSVSWVVGDVSNLMLREVAWNQENCY